MYCFPDEIVHQQLSFVDIGFYSLNSNLYDGYLLRLNYFLELLPIIFYFLKQCARAVAYFNAFLEVVAILWASLDKFLPSEMPVFRCIIVLPFDRLE
jgi:hypothetical protein